MLRSQQVGICPFWCFHPTGTRVSAGRMEDNTSPVTPNFHPAGEAPAGELHALLLAENRRLREELARPPSPPLPPSTPRPPQNTFGGTEKLSLLAKLEEAQARGRAMERQVGITSTPRSGEAQGVPPRAA